MYGIIVKKDAESKARRVDNKQTGCIFGNIFNELHLRSVSNFKFDSSIHFGMKIAVIVFNKSFSTKIKLLQFNLANYVYTQTIQASHLRLVLLSTNIIRKKFSTKKSSKTWQIQTKSQRSIHFRRTISTLKIFQN
jgi:hypothetical protein